MPQEQQAKSKNPGQFRKGKSGNPGGRPKGIASFPALLQRKLPRAKLAELLAKAAEAGEPWAIQAALDRYWPKTTRIEGELETSPREGPHVEPFTSSDQVEREKSADGAPVH